MPSCDVSLGCDRRQRHSYERSLKQTRPLLERNQTEVCQQTASCFSLTSSVLILQRELLRGLRHDSKQPSREPRNICTCGRSLSRPTNVPYYNSYNHACLLSQTLDLIHLLFPTFTWHIKWLQTSTCCLRLLVLNALSLLGQLQTQLVLVPVPDVPRRSWVRLQFLHPPQHLTTAARKEYLCLIEYRRATSTMDH
jgi:hypothetical protein